MIRYIGIDERLRVNMIIIDSYREILVADIISIDWIQAVFWSL